jgi:hypothetical protein
VGAQGCVLEKMATQARHREGVNAKGDGVETIREEACTELAMPRNAS